MKKRFSQGLALCMIAWLTVAAPAVAAAPVWPQAASELTADPAVRFGVLPNGLRYAVMRNDSPKGQVAMRLQIRAGSMHEARDQEGLAHFIEHMAFRGTSKVADGEMIQSLQRLGLQFGADTNASTSQVATTYMFNLPRSDTASVETGLMLLREIASEVKLDPTLARAESGVILSEERARAGEQLNAAKMRTELVYGEHPFARLPIGREEVITAADVGRMRAFYNAYYRPEKSILVVVGDIDPSSIETRIKSEFSTWIGKGPAGSDPAPLSPTNRPAQFAALDGKPLISQLSLIWVKPYELPGDSQAQLLDRWIRTVTQGAVSRRLSSAAEEAGRPFAGASLSESTAPGVSRTVSLDAVLVNDWKASLNLLMKTKGQVVAYGFTQEELDEILIQGRAAYKAAADGAATRSSSGLAEALLASATNGVVFRTPADILADFDRLAPQITLARVNAKAAELFGGQGPLVLLSAPGAPQADVSPLRTAYETAAAAPIERLVQAAIKPWSHTDFGKTGTVVEQREIEGLGIIQVRFANGVRLSFKRNTNIQNQIGVRVRFGHGIDDLPADRPGMSTAASTILGTGALADYAPTELARALSGKQASVSFGMSENEFVASGLTRPADLATQLQLMAARFSSPGWRPDLYLATRDASARMTEAFATTPGLAYAAQADLLLHNGDIRWKTPTLADLAALPAADARAFIEPILATAPLEVLISGDTTLETAIAEVAKTFGALPARTGAETAVRRPPSFPAPTIAPVVVTHAGRPDQAVAAIAWPISDARPGPKDALTGDILASVMRSRLIEQFRAYDGKAYSPGVASNFSYSSDGYAFIHAQSQVAAGDIDAFYTTAKAVAADLAATPISADELARAVTPIAETYLRNRQNNVYWLNWMNRLSYTPWAPAHMRSMPADLTAITPQDVQDAAKKWLTPDRIWQAKVVAANTN